MVSPKVFIFIVFASIFIQCNRNESQLEMQDSQLSDAEKFALEFPLIGKDNIFVYRNASETADILTNGRGIVFMGFKECPWCQPYTVFLHDVAREMEVEKIYYYDIKEDRQNNTEGYQKIISILSGYLQYDDEGRSRVYVPDVTILSRGRIIDRDFETSKETLGCSTPQEYWNNERINALKERIREGIKILKKLNDRSCNTC